MGKIEEITRAMEPLQECHHDIITWYAAEDRIDILRVPDSFKGWNDFTLLFHTKEKKMVRVFFRDILPHDSGKKQISREEYVRTWSVYSGENLFQCLHIPYPHPSGDPIQDLATLSREIQANFSRINDAFSDKNILKTHLELSRSGLENLDEIKQAFWDASGFE